MKKLLSILILISLFTLGATAQTINTTTADKKVAVLEEYTGIYCTFCPDGHRVSNEIKANNPGKFFAINIHEGGFAVPSEPNDPDFRTAFGPDLSGQTGLVGYPSGTVNRRVFSGSVTALDRGDWSKYADTVYNEDSPVNIAIDASLDVDSRLLTVNVALFYTDPSAVQTADTTNRLTVALLQDNIAGPQTGSNYNPSQEVGDFYLHMHVVRDLFTNTFGDTIKIDSGVVISKTYTKTLPEKYNNTLVNLADLSVVAFIARNKQEIFTGAEKKILLPARYNASMETRFISHTRPSSLCEYSGSVQMSYKNTGTNNITSFTSSLSFTNGEGINIDDVQEVFSGNLAPNDSVIITFNYDSTLIKRGANSLFLNPISLVSNASNPLFLDKNIPTSLGLVSYFSERKITAFPFLEGFESVNTASSLTSNTFRTLNVSFPETFTPRANEKLGGFSESANSLFFTMFIDDSLDLVLDKMDFSTFGPQSGMAFAYAKSFFGLTTDSINKLEVVISTDCGKTWTSVWTKQGFDLISTKSPTNGIYFGGVKEDWRWENINLSAFAGKSDVLIRFVSTGFGQSLFVDDIKVGPNLLSTNELFSGTNKFSIYPNPAKNHIILSLSQSEDSKTSNQTVSLSITDITGRIVYSTNTSTKLLRNNLSVSTGHFASGIYIVKLNAGNSTHTSKLVIE